MRREGSTVYVTGDDAATLRQIADEYGLDVPGVRTALELTDSHDADELLRPRVAALYRLVLDSQSTALAHGGASTAP